MKVLRESPEMNGKQVELISEDINNYYVMESGKDSIQFHNKTLANQKYEERVDNLFYDHVNSHIN